MTVVRSCNERGVITCRLRLILHLHKSHPYVFSENKAESARNLSYGSLVLETFELNVQTALFKLKTVKFSASAFFFIKDLRFHTLLKIVSSIISSKMPNSISGSKILCSDEVWSILLSFSFRGDCYPYLLSTNTCINASPPSNLKLAAKELLRI